MNLNDALAVIAGFSKKSTEVFSAGNNAASSGKPLSSTFSDSTLPIELADYIDRICPENGLTLEGVGHPVELIKSADLAWKPEMFLQLTGDLAKWEDDWFLIAHEGGDPIIVKASEQGESSAVYSAMQGMGFWDFAPIADSIGQFLVLSLIHI